MTRFLLIRHGESEGNILHFFSGTTDVALTERGLQQAELTAEWLDRYKIDVLYASDLLRAQQTAKPVGARQGLPVLPLPGMREINGGVWERQPFEELPVRYPEDYDRWANQMDRCRCPGGESVAELHARVRDTMLELAEKHPGQTVCIATHATPIRTLKCVWMGWELQKIMSYPWVKNASVSEVEYENGKWNLVLDGYAEHLSGLITGLPSAI